MDGGIFFLGQTRVKSARVLFGPAMSPSSRVPLSVDYDCLQCLTLACADQWHLSQYYLAVHFPMITISSAYGLATRADTATQSEFSLHFATKTQDFYRSEFCGVLIRSGYEVVAKLLRRGRNPFIQPVLETCSFWRFQKNSRQKNFSIIPENNLIFCKLESIFFL